MSYYSLNDFIINGFYGTYVDTDNVSRHYYKLLSDLTRRIYNWKYDSNDYHIKEKLKSLYGAKIFNTKENKTMTNFQWISSNKERYNEFIDDYKRLSLRNFYKKYGIVGVSDTILFDVLNWLKEERVPPKTECYDFYKLVKFVSNPALFSLDETIDILYNIGKLDNYRYHKGYGEYSVAVKKDNAIDVIFNSKLRVNRKSLVTERLNALPVLNLDLTQASPTA